MYKNTTDEITIEGFGSYEINGVVTYICGIKKYKKTEFEKTVRIISTDTVRIVSNKTYAQSHYLVVRPTTVASVATDTASQRQTLNIKSVNGQTNHWLVGKNYILDKNYYGGSIGKIPMDFNYEADGQANLNTSTTTNYAITGSLLTHKEY